MSEISYAVRMLRKSPAVTAVAVLSLALGIGANTAIFTMIESTLLRPIAVKHLDRLRLPTWREVDGGWVAPNVGYLSSSFGSIYEQGERDGLIAHAEFSPAVYREFQEHNTVFDILFAFKELGRATVVIDGDAEPVNCFLVSGDFYRGVEVSPAIGRVIAPADDVRTAAGQVAVISYEYWTRRFARDSSVIGRTIVVDEVPLTVIGVNPESFTGIEPGAHFDIWAPLNLAPALTGRPWLDDPRQWQIPMLGRLKPGVTDERAQAELSALFQAYVDASHGPLASMLKDPAKRPQFLLQSAGRGVDYLSQRYDRMMLAVLALAGLVLLIACANVANLLLAKSAARQREISLRLALGAGRGRIVRQLLTEGLLLSSMAGAAGVVFGYWTRNGIPALLTTPWRRSTFDTSFNPVIVIAAIGVTLLTGVLFSLAPVWQTRKVAINEALKDSSRGTAGLSKLRLGRFLVVIQVALCVLLLAGAGLCVKTFSSLKDAPLGFRPDGLLMFTLDPPRLRYQGDQTVDLLTRVQQRLASVAGVRSASFSRNFRDNSVSSGFFETMGIAMLAGRPLNEHDATLNSGEPPAAVINAAFARRNFPNENPVDRIYRDPQAAAYRILGECADWRYDRLRDEPQPVIYTLLAPSGRPTPLDPAAVHGPFTPATFELRIVGSQAAVVQEVRRAVAEVDPNLTIFDVRTAAQQVADGLSQERLLASLALVFGGLAVILAIIGIYGVMAYAVARRTGEIGIRVALGAMPSRMAWMVLREALTLAAMGIAIGIPIVLALGPILDHFLAPGWEKNFVYGTDPNDPLTILAVVLALAAVGAVAGYLPARRAATVDAMVALRHE